MTMTSTERTLRRASTAPSSPAAAPLKAAKRSLSKLGRKHSNGSVQSTSSTGTARSVEGVSIRQPAKSRIRRHQHRLSSVFSRSMLTPRGEMATTGEELSPTDDPSELSSHITAPGILKIFGNEICEGANYKSVLATTHSSAKELVKEALERYSLNKADADAYVLCDVIGCMGERGWRGECVRVVGDNERPLLLQSLWKPREGYARRFEIHGRASVEEKISRDKDTVTAGINAQARKLQKTRSRGRSMALDSGEHGVVPGVAPSLCRSLSEADLRTSLEPQQSLKSRLGGDDSEAVAHKGFPCAVGEKEEPESGDDNRTQYSIHPPMHFPYFLLLQGFSYKQDLIVYPLQRSSTVFGRNAKESEEQRTSDVMLCAPDIQPQHCHIRRLPVSEPKQEVRGAAGVTLTPLQGALVKRNGATVKDVVELHSGDVVSLGEHYLFMFKDPNAQTLENSFQPQREPARLPNATPLPLHPTCVPGLESSQSSSAPEETMPCLRDSSQRKLDLSYDVENETQIVEEIFLTADCHGEAHKLTASFLLGLCLQHSATHFPMTDLRRLLLHIANEVQMAVLERAKTLAAVQHEPEDGDHAVGTDRLLTGLQQLLKWMANSIELLHFIHQELPCLLYGLSRMEEEEEEDCMAVLELRLSTVRAASEEAMTVLEEVIMFTFQQCVYYLTKLLYPILPALLDGNPFSENGQLQIPDDVASVLDVLSRTLDLVRSCHVHPEMSFQLFTYLFFFINAFLFNQLMERGSGGSFYQWSCGVQIRANLDMLIDWACTAGLGEVAQNRLLKLSSAVNLLATPREHLLQASWKSLRAEFSSLTPAQLHHILREYDARRSCPSAWTPCGEEADAAHRTADILESFDDHPPLVLPVDGFVLDLKRSVGDEGLIKQLSQLQAFIKTCTEMDTPKARHSQHDSAVPLEAKCTKLEVLPKAHLELGQTQLVLPQICDPANHSVPADLSVSESLLTQKLSALELLSKEANPSDSAEHPDHLCLPTPPTTPLCSDLIYTDDQDGQRCDASKRGEGGCEQDRTGNDDVFVVELQKGPDGLGLALVDGVETPLKTSGIYIKSVIPGSPAALSQRLRPGDRLLAVNGLRLIGLDYHVGRELIQKAGDQAQLLVGRTINQDAIPQR